MGALPPKLVGILALVAVIMLVWFVFRNRFGRVRGGAACSQCGYLRIGLETDHCPECGTLWGSASRRFEPSTLDLWMFLAAMFVPVVIAMLFWLLLF